MSFTLPSVKVKPDIPDNFVVSEGLFGVQDVLKNGLGSSRCNTEALHPIEASELKYNSNRDNMNMMVLRNAQGLHAPLRLAMELRSAKKVGRLPFLASSNVMYDSLTGKDWDIGPEDRFNTSEFWEVSGQPHAVVEKSLNIL